MRFPATVLTIWFAAALIVGASGFLARLPVPPPAVAIALTAALLVVVRQLASVRAAVRGVGLKPLVSFHLVRIVAGAYFLLLERRGVLPDEFAIVAGWGDITVGVAAIAVLAFCLPIRTPVQRTGLRVWNAAGLVDIVAVLANGARIFVQNPSIGEPFTVLPLALLPLFVVPIVIATHVILFAPSSVSSEGAP